MKIQAEISEYNRWPTLRNEPGKSNSKTGRMVIERMKAKNQIIDHPIRGTIFQASDGEWYSIKYGDMSHKTPAVFLVE